MQGVDFGGYAVDVFAEMKHALEGVVVVVTGVDFECDFFGVQVLPGGHHKTPIAEAGNVTVVGMGVYVDASQSSLQMGSHGIVGNGGQYGPVQGVRQELFVHCGLAGACS